MDKKSTRINWRASERERVHPGCNQLIESHSRLNGESKAKIHSEFPSLI